MEEGRKGGFSDLIFTTAKVVFMTVKNAFIFIS